VPNATRRNGWKRWTEDDLRELRDLARAQLPKELIGLRMGRSPEAVAQRAWLEGLTLPARRARTPARNPAPPEERVGSGPARSALLHPGPPCVP
jgi:hypothetical protein